jgi:putative ABC transport system permease protein
MINPRWHKVFKDLTSNKVRTLLVIFTIAIGVFAVGFVGDMFFITLPDLDNNYQRVDPHAAILYTDPFTDELLPSLQRIPGVGQVEGRSSVGGRILRPNGEWATLTVTGLPPLEEMQIDKLFPAQPGGSIAPLGDREIYLERSSQSILQVAPGDFVTVELPDGTRRQLKVADFVYDVTNPPFIFAQAVTAYTSQDTIVWLGGNWEFNQILMTVLTDKTNEAHVNAVAKDVGDKIEAGGRQVYFTFVYQPGRHFAADITRALGALMMFLGALSVGVSAFLVINTLNALLNQQVRQIGVMKAVGARTRQLMGMYLILTLFFGLLALAIAIPLSILLSTLTGGGISNFLNFDPGPLRLAPQSVALQTFVALVIPVGAALFPVVKGTRITVREAITNYGLGRGGFGRGWVDRLVELVRGLPRPILISIRNTFRRKGRLVLTLSALVLAGGIFIGVFNLRAAMNVAISETFGYILSDVNVGFNRAYRLQKVLPMALRVPGVVKAEAWGGAFGSMLRPGEATGTQVSLLAPPADSNLIKATITSGRWLVPEDENALVIGNSLLAERPDLQVGDEVVLDINGVKHTWEIVGVYRFVGTSIPPLVYANNDYLARITHTANRATNLRVVTSQHDPVFQKQVARDLEATYKAAGIEVGQIVIGSDLIQSNTATTDVLVLFLLVMAVLIALVGGLGMASTMSINVFERTREIGVMRAIGASNGAILRLVIFEGMFIGGLSWILGTLVAVPIARVLDYVVGISILRSPLKYVFSLDGFLIWLAFVLLIAIAASAIPARNAMRLTVREILAYE